MINASEAWTLVQKSEEKEQTQCIEYGDQILIYLNNEIIKRANRGYSTLYCILYDECCGTSWAKEIFNFAYSDRRTELINCHILATLHSYGYNASCVDHNIKKMLGWEIDWVPRVQEKESEIVPC